MGAERVGRSMYDCDEKCHEKQNSPRCKLAELFSRAHCSRETFTLLSALYVRRIKLWSANTRMPPQDAVSLPGFILGGGPVQQLLYLLL